MEVIYVCPADKRLLCSWEGCASEIKQHFESEHNELLFHTNSVEIDLGKLPENKLIYLNEELYLMQVCTESGKVVVKLRYLGSKESANKIQYEITVSVNNITYRYNPLKFSIVVPRIDGWEIIIDPFEKIYGKINTIICNIILEEPINIGRKFSNYSLHNFEANVLQDLSMLDQKIKNLKRQESQDKPLKRQQSEQQELKRQQSEKDELKQQQDGEEEKLLRQEKKDPNDYMDRISVLDFETPFNEKYEDFKKQMVSENLSDIPEEANLSCSSCSLDMLPPIFVCMNGHNICNWCKNSPCKICSAVVTSNKNIDLENYSRTHLHRCRYSADGCNEKLYYNEIRAHEAKCSFCKYKCPLMNCPYQGRYEHFSNHLKVVHSSVKTGYSTRNEIPKNTTICVLNPTLGVFYCSAELKDDFMIWRAMFCGPSERQFSCEISFRGSKYKEPIFLKRRENVWEVRKPLSELKKNKAKEKYAVLSIISFDA